MTSSDNKKTSRVRINLGARKPTEPQPESRVRINLTGRKK
jgi:hypothetical protein